MEWDWEFVVEILPTIFEGFIVTVKATFWGSIIALLNGLFLAIGKQSSIKSVRNIFSFTINFIRGTPLLVQLYFLFYVLPDIGILLSPLLSGVIGIGIHYSSYTAEVYRAGIENIPRGQLEASKALNFTTTQTWTRVIIPQALPPMIPALSNYIVAMFKETPLLSVITVLEMMNQARSVANYSYRYLEPMTLVGVFFLLISIPSVILLKYLEKKFSPAAQ